MALIARRFTSQQTFLALYMLYMFTMLFVGLFLLSMIHNSNMSYRAYIYCNTVYIVYHWNAL